MRLYIVGLFLGVIFGFVIGDSYAIHRVEKQFQEVVAIANRKQDLAWKIWTDYCRSQGGIVQQVTPHQSECFKDGKMILHYE